VGVDGESAASAIAAVGIEPEAAAAVSVCRYIENESDRCADRREVNYANVADALIQSASRDGANLMALDGRSRGQAVRLIWFDNGLRAEPPQ